MRCVGSISHRQQPKVSLVWLGHERSQAVRTLRMRHGSGSRRPAEWKAALLAAIHAPWGTAAAASSAGLAGPGLPHCALEQKDQVWVRSDWIEPGAERRSGREAVQAQAGWCRAAHLVDQLGRSVRHSVQGQGGCVLPSQPSARHLDLPAAGAGRVHQPHAAHQNGGSEPAVWS